MMHARAILATVIPAQVGIHAASPHGMAAAGFHGRCHFHPFGISCGRAGGSAFARRAEDAAPVKLMDGERTDRGGRWQ